jgi:hypothetical protein
VTILLGCEEESVAGPGGSGRKSWRMNTYLKYMKTLQGQKQINWFTVGWDILKVMIWLAEDSVAEPVG